MTKLYLDLDGVFADCAGPMRNLTGFPYLEDPVGTWKVIDKIPHFFYTLPLLKDAKTLYNAIEARSRYPIVFLTALPIQTGYLVDAKEDKKKWVRDILGSNKPVICVDHWSIKKEYCTNKDIIVEDSIRNVMDWESSGGIAILHDSKNPYYTLYSLTKKGILRG